MATMHAFRALFDQNDLLGAEREGAELLRGPPDETVDVLLRLGLLRRRASDPAAALAVFARAATIARASGLRLPDWVPSETAGAHMDRREWTQALATAEAGMVAKPALRLLAVSALLHLGRLIQAREMLREAVGLLSGEPGRAAAVANVCRALLAADRSGPTLEITAGAMSAFAGSPAFAEVEATLAVLRPDWAPAATAAKAGGTDEASLRRLNALLRDAPGQQAAFAPVFEASVLAAPANEGVLFQWREFLLRSCTEEQVTEQFARLQDGSAAALPAVLVQLSRRLKTPELHARFAGPIESWRRSDTAVACQAYLDAACRFAEPAPGIAERVLAAPFNAVRLFCLLRQPRMRTARLRGPGAAESATLGECGVATEAFAAFVSDMVGPLEPVWAEYLRTAAFASPDAAQIVHADEGFTSFQDRVVRDRSFAMLDPATGAPADLFDSVKIHDRQVFSFRGTELFTLHTGGNMNFALYIHLVRQNVLLLLDTRENPSKQGFYAQDGYLAEIMAVWLRRAASNHAALLQSAAAAPAHRGQPCRIVAIHGRAENPAHHIWNYLPPFERLALAGTIGNIDTLVAPPTHYFGPVPGLYPELAGAELRELKEAAAIDPCPFSPANIALQLGSSFVPAGLIARVRRWAESVVPGERLAEMAALAKRRPVIWIGLRVGDKMWVNQAAGLARMIDLIVPLYPHATFLLDGFSLPDASHQVPEKWRAAVDALQTEAEAVRSGTAHPGAVHSLVGNTLAESVLWARSTDAYFTPMGSSQHKVGWYCDAPGLVYTSGKHGPRPAVRRQGSWEAEGSRVPEFLIGEIAALGQRRGAHDFRTNLENIDFAPHVAARRLLAILGQRGGPAMD